MDIHSEYPMLSMLISDILLDIQSFLLDIQFLDSRPPQLLCFAACWIFVCASTFFSAVASLSLKTFSRNYKSYLLSAQRASPGAHCHGTAREKQRCCSAY